MKSSPTQETYRQLQIAYEYFNQELFDNRLPECLITYQRKPKMKGYFADGRFEHVENGTVIDEIAINPDYFRGDSISPKTVLSTLVHEMCHLWQKYFGKPGRNRYHNQEWADMMVKVGLRPTDNGTLSGKMTGDSMSHLIIEDGPFERVSERLLQRIKITWVDRWSGQVTQKSSSPKNKIKYVCPHCHVNVWGKPDIHIICGACGCRLMKV